MQRYLGSDVLADTNLTPYLTIPRLLSFIKTLIKWRNNENSLILA